MGTTDRPRWNHNIHYHRIVLDALPSTARTALDVGSGNGLLAADLRELVPQVTGIDRDESVLTGARDEHEGIDWVHGDVLTHEFDRTFDIVASIATVHHLPDLPITLRRLAGLTAPGGVLVVVGLARPTRLRDYAFSALGLIQHRWYTWRHHGYWEHSAPMVLPPHSYTEVRCCAMETLPGVQWRQLPLWRYALIWRRTRTQPSRVGDCAT